MAKKKMVDTVEFAASAPTVPTPVVSGEEEGRQRTGLSPAITEALAELGPEASSNEVKDFIRRKNPDKTKLIEALETPSFSSSLSGSRKKARGDDGKKTPAASSAVATIDHLRIVNAQLKESGLKVKEFAGDVQAVADMAEKVGGLTNLLKIVETLVEFAV